MTLTKTQAKILAFIRKHVADKGYPPTRSEICEHMGYESMNSAQDALKALAAKGAIELTIGTPRGIRVVR